MAADAGPLTTLNVTISAGQSLSGAVDISGASLVGIFLPSGWTAASLTFQASPDGTSFGELQGEVGALNPTSPAASTHIVLNPSRYYGVRFLKVRSGTSGTPVNQVSTVTLVLVLQVIP